MRPDSAPECQGCPIPGCLFIHSTSCLFLPLPYSSCLFLHPNVFFLSPSFSLSLFCSGLISGDRYPRMSRCALHLQPLCSQVWDSYSENETRAVGRHFCRMNKFHNYAIASQRRGGLVMSRSHSHISASQVWLTVG